MTHKLLAIKFFACVVFCIVILFITCSLIIYKKLDSYVLPYKQPYQTDFDYEINRPQNISYTALRNEVDDLFGNPKYTLNFVDMNGGVYGRTFILSNTIELRKDINYEYFVFCLSHELVHLRYFTYSERFCNLTAYDILYNSNNEYFVNIALYFAYIDLHGGFSEEYSFIGYL